MNVLGVVVVVGGLVLSGWYNKYRQKRELNRRMKEMGERLKKDARNRLH